MKRKLKYLGLLLLISLASATGYYAYAVYEARGYTKRIILVDLGNSQWRQPNGIARKFEIRSGDLTRRQTEILMKVEDPGFYTHKGIDLWTPGAGLTTITQGIVKKLYFKDFAPGIAKIKQSLIARFVVNDLISKDDQLTLFLNSMYFGRVSNNPVVGIESGAQAYYHQPIKLLTEDQFISLIAMIIAPETFHITKHPEWNRDRTNRIKELIAGRYKPKGLMDQYYGELPQEVVKSGLAPASYFGDSYKSK